MSLYLGKQQVGTTTKIMELNPVAPENDVIFIDYDGTIRYSYTKEEFMALTVLPPNPIHEGLIAQGWNWTLSDAKNYVSNYKELVIGQQYITSDEKTRFYIRIESGRLSPYFGIAINGTAVINWGDESTDTITGTSTSTLVYKRHTFPDSGNYIVTLDITGNASIIGDTYIGSRLFSNNTTQASSTNRAYQAILQKVELGDNITIGNNAFQKCVNLKSITSRNGMSNYGSSAFQGCVSLKGLIIPQNNTAFGNNTCQEAMGLKRVSLPKGFISSLNYSFYYCYALERICISPSATTNSGNSFCSCFALTRITLPEGLTSLGANIFQSSAALTNIDFPSTLTSIGANAFNNCNSLGKMRFRSTTPPSVLNSNAWTSVPTDCYILVPFSALAAYLAGTNYPNPATYTYIGFATYDNGVTLPLTDTTSSYNVTWYATKADALASTNAISAGNGKEVYCNIYYNLE